MSFWTECKCKGCNTDIYWAEVRPPGSTQAKWLPFEDEDLQVCHLERCTGLKPTYYAIKCPYCHKKFRATESALCRCDNKRCKELFRVAIEFDEAVVTTV